MSTLKRIPPNFFAMPFGLAGLGGVWRLEAIYGRAPGGIADALFITAAIAWLTIALGCLARWVQTPRLIFSEVTDPVLAPFWALPLIVGMQLSVALQPHAGGLARVCFEVFLALTVLFGGWITGQWLTGQLKPGQLHPGYFLPTVAGGLIGAQGTTAFGLTGLGWMSFGIGIVCWLLLGSLVVNRLMFSELPPPGLLPTLAIELAPPSVAGGAYFALHGPRPDTVAYGLAGYAALMVIAQLRFLPIYLRLHFVAGFWSFAFSWCAVAALALRWLEVEHPSGAAALADVVAAAVSALVAGIAARSLVAIAGHTFLPPPPSLPGRASELRAEVEQIAIGDAVAGQGPATHTPLRRRSDLSSSTQTAHIERPTQ